MSWLGGGRFFLQWNKLTVTPSQQIILEKTEIFSKRYGNDVVPLGSGALCNNRPQKNRYRINLWNY